MSESFKTETAAKYRVEGTPEEVWEKIRTIYDDHGVLAKQRLKENINSFPIEGIDISDVDSVYIFSKPHRKDMVTSFLTAFNPKAEAEAVLISYKNPQGIVDILPLDPDGPINAESLKKAGLELTE